MSLSFRAPRSDESAAVIALYRRGLLEREGWRVSLEPLLLGNTLVAELEGQVVGVACWSVVSDPAFEPDLAARVPVHTGDWVFTALVVEPEHWRRGIGTALAVERIRQAREAGAHQILVQCIEGAGTRELYQRLGFEAVRTEPAYYRDGSGMTLLRSVP